MVRRPGRAGGAAAGPRRQRGAAGEQGVAKLGFGAASPARPLRLEVPQPRGVKSCRVFRGALEAAAPRREGGGGRQGRGAVEGPSLLLGGARGVEAHTPPGVPPASGVLAACTDSSKFGHRAEANEKTVWFP